MGLLQPRRDISDNAQPWPRVGAPDAFSEQNVLISTDPILAIATTSHLASLISTTALNSLREVATLKFDQKLDEGNAPAHNVNNPNTHLTYDRQVHQPPSIIDATWSNNSSSNRESVTVPLHRDDFQSIYNVDRQRQLDLEEYHASRNDTSNRDLASTYAFPVDNVRTAYNVDQQRQRDLEEYHASRNDSSNRDLASTYALPEGNARVSNHSPPYEMNIPRSDNSKIHIADNPAQPATLAAESRVVGPQIISQLHTTLVQQDTLQAVSPASSFMPTSKTKNDKIPFTSPSGTPLRICPKRVPIDYAIYWYFHPKAASFLICSHCYHTKIATTDFASHFVQEFKSEIVPRNCMFHVDRMQNLLWPRAVATRNLTEVLKFMCRRSEIKCTGTTKSNDTSIKWFTHKHDQPVQGFIICEACYEDIVLAKQFAEDFQPYSIVQTVDNFWACDAAFPSVQRAFLNSNDSATWIEAARLGIKRHGLEPCPAARSGDTSRVQWYKPIKHIEGFAICEPCYFDHVVNTPFADQFEFAAPIWQIGWSCDFSAWSVRFAWEAAILKKDYDSFWKIADKIMHSPFCAPEGMESNLWYTLEPGLKDFNVCPACYEGIFHAYDCENHLIPQAFNQGESKPVTCSMWRESPRARMYINKFCEAVDTLQFSLFSNLVTAICSAPICPRDTTWTNRRWYGYSAALFCEECYALFVKDTSLARDGKLEMNFETVPEARFCSIYSPRMRTKWLEACSSGDVQPFLDFARHREEVHSRTMPEVRRLIEMMQMRQMMSLSMGFAAMMTHSGDSISNMAGGTSESWSVTTSDGFHGTGGSELGAQRQADFERSMADVSRMDDMTRGTYLEGLWRNVE